MREWPPQTEELRQIQGVCFDIDDTFSTDGFIESEPYQRLWELRKCGYALVAITGRPAGWCDLIARFWPVHAVVGENGAFTFFKEDKNPNQIRSRIDTPNNETRQGAAAKLEELKKKVKEVFTAAKWASDQNYREFDLAIDIREDVEPWSHDDIQSLIQLCKSTGAHVKESSIHVNAWYGDYDKFSGFSHWCAKSQPGWDGPPVPLDQWIYVGDSPNDEPMFEKFPFSAGVANLSPYLKQLRHKPTWNLTQASGGGFCELAQALIQLHA